MTTIPIVIGGRAPATIEVGQAAGAAAAGVAAVQAAIATALASATNADDKAALAAAATMAANAATAGANAAAAAIGDISAAVTTTQTLAGQVSVTASGITAGIRRVLTFSGIRDSSGDAVGRITGAQLIDGTPVGDRVIVPVPRVLGLSVLSFSGFRESSSDQKGNLFAGSTLFNQTVGAAGGSGTVNTQPETLVGGVELRDVRDRGSHRSLPQLFQRLTTALWAKLTDGPYAVALIAAAATSATMYRQGVQSPISWRAVRIGSAAGATPRTLYLHLGIGQSLRQGHTDGAQEHQPPWTGEAHPRALMFKSDAIDGWERGPRPFQLAPVVGNKGVVIADVQLAGFGPLYGSVHARDENRAQTSSESFALAMHGLYLSGEDLSLHAIVGTGSTASQYFLPGTAHDTSSRKIIDRAFALRDSLNAVTASTDWRLVVVTDSQQGEQDNSDGVPQATIAANWTSIVQGLKGYVEGKGGVFAGHVFTQTHQVVGTQSGPATLAQAQLIRSGSPYFGHPIYHCRPGASGSTHLLPLTNLPVGCTRAFVTAALLAGEGASVYVAATDAKLIDATHSQLTITGGTAPFQFDTATIPDRPDGNKGLDIVDDNGPVAVSNVAIAGRVVTITHAATSTALHAKVNIGITGISQMPSANGVRTNIRGASGATCSATGQVIAEFLLCDQLPLLAA